MQEMFPYLLNGISVGEFGQCVFLANIYGVTPIFASGCLAFTKEAEALVPGIETVAVKEGVQPGTGNECTEDEYRLRNGGAIHLHPEVARKLIREGAEAGIKVFVLHPSTPVTEGMPRQERKKNAMEILRQEAESRQVILFTCQGREH